MAIESPKILGVTGEKYAGKDTVVDYVMSKYKTFHVRHSAVLDEILNILDLPTSRRNEIDLGMGLRKTFGEGVLNKGIRKSVLLSNADLKIISSIRFPDEMDSVKNLGAKVWYVTAPLETRFARSQNRQEKADDQGQSLEDFKNMELEPTEVIIPSLKMQADYVIENTGSLEELHGKVDKILKEMGW